MGQDGKMSVEQMQKALLEAEKSGRFGWEELGPLWEKAKEAIETEQQAVALYTTFIYMARRYQDRKAEGGNADYSQVEELFQEASDFLTESFEDECTSATIQLEKNFAFFCYTKTKKLDQAREIWNSLLEEEQSAFPWLEAITLERAYGDVEHTRRLFYKALDAVGYRTDELFSRFVQFEREEGTRAELDAALERVNAKVAEQNTRLKQQEYRQQKMQKIRAETGEDREAEKVGGKGGREANRGRGGGRGARGGGRQQQNARNNRGAGKQRNEKTLNGAEERRQKNRKEEDEDERMDTDVGQAVAADGGPRTATFETSAVPLGPVIPGMMPDHQKEEEKPEKAEDETTKKEEMEEEDDEKRKGVGKRKRTTNSSSEEKTFPYAMGLEKNKLFVKKLHLGCTGEELKQFFEKFGTVRDARVVTKWNGRSKGCAYVEFADEEGTNAALMGADGAELRGRKIAVFLSNPPAKKPRMDDQKQDDSGGVAVTATTSAASNIPSKTFAAQPSQSGPPQRIQTTKTATSFAPRAAVLAGGTRQGRGGRLALPGAISKATAAASPVGIVTRSTGEMSLEQEQQQMNQNNNSGEESKQ